MRPLGLVLRSTGRFWHQGAEVTNARLHRAFLRGVRWAEPEGTFIVQIGHFRGWLDVEDVAFWVTSYDEASGEVELSDGSCEVLDAESLSVDSDEVLRCIVKQRFPARMTRTAQGHLLNSVEVQEDRAVVVRAAAKRLRAPGLDGLA